MFEAFNTRDSLAPHEFLLSLLESSLYGVLAFTSERDETNEIKDFRCVYANTEASRILTIALTELDGAPFDTLFPLALSRELFPRFVEVIEQDEPQSIEHELKTAKGERRWFNISIARMSDGITMSFQEITDLKQALIASHNKQKKFERLFEESIDAIFTATEHFELSNQNEAMDKTFGSLPAAEQGPTLKDLFVDDAVFTTFSQQLTGEGNVEEFEAELTAPGGPVRDCLINAVVFYDEQLRSPQYLGVIRDMSRRKQAERQILRAEKLSMTGKLARTIAHEVRNPLTNITLALEQLQDEVEGKVEDADLYIDMIRRNAERVGNLITDLLNSSKPKEVTLKQQSLQVVVGEALALVMDRINLQEMTAKEEYDKDLPLLPLDKDLLKVALVNLFINAIEAMRPEEGMLHVSTSRNESHIVLSIADNGIGIPPENINQLFEPFFTAKKEGTGLGLTTVSNIIHSHGGHIDVQSQQGEGTTFSLFFPLPVACPSS